MTLRDSVLSAFDEVLDKMAFLFLDEGEEDPSEPPAFTRAVRINFSGGMSGALTLYLTEASAQQIARNLMGMGDEEPVTEELLGDAVKEFTNMITGRCMTLRDPQHRVDLDVPALLAPAEAPLAGDAAEEISGMLDEQPVLVRLTLNA